MFRRKNRTLARLRQQNEEILRLKKDYQIRDGAVNILIRQLLRQEKIKRTHRQFLSDIIQLYKEIQENKRLSYKARYNKLNKLIGDVEKASTIMDNWLGETYESIV